MNIQTTKNVHEIKDIAWLRYASRLKFIVTHNLGQHIAWGPMLAIIWQTDDAAGLDMNYFYLNTWYKYCYARVYAGW